MAGVPGTARGWCAHHYRRWRLRGDPLSSTVPKAQRPAEERFWEKVVRKGAGDCWEWQAARDGLGYGFFRVISGQNMRKTNRVAWELVNGPIPLGQHVCHRCDNPPCCNPGHLFLGTHAENMADRNRKGRTTKGRVLHCGEQSGLSAKLTLSDVSEIVNAYSAGGVSQDALGRKYGVSQTQVGRVIRQERWRLARVFSGESLDDSYSRARPDNNYQRNKTHCDRNHLLAAPNLPKWIQAAGYRTCLACHRAKGNFHYAASRGRIIDLQETADRHYRKIMETEFSSFRNLMSGRK